MGFGRAIGPPRLCSNALQKSRALIERKYPEFNNELVTAVELSRRKEVDVSNPAAYQAMLGRVHQSINRRIDSVERDAAELATDLGSVGCIRHCDCRDAHRGLRFARLVYALVRAFVQSVGYAMATRAVLSADGIQVQVPAFTGQLAAERILIPFEENLARLPVGAAALLQVSASTKAVAVPETCTLFYRADDGSRGRANLRRVGAPESGWQHFTLEGPPLDGLTSDLSFDVVGLDARLRDLKLQVVEPAVVADMQIECRYPEYLNDSLSNALALSCFPIAAACVFRKELRSP